MKKKMTVSLFLVLTLLLNPVWAYAQTKIVINKATNQLLYYQGNNVVKTFPVATGRKPNLTPEGNFTIVLKLINPYYYRLKIPGGSPNNPLGVRWLGLSIQGGGVYGIHGTNNPASIGTYASSGCIRMFNKDVIWLFERIPIGTTVQIVSVPASVKTTGKATTSKQTPPAVEKPADFSTGESPGVANDTSGEPESPAKPEPQYEPTEIAAYLLWEFAAGGRGNTSLDLMQHVYAVFQQ